MFANDKAEDLALELLFLEAKIASNIFQRFFRRKQFLNDLNQIKKGFLIIKKRQNIEGENTLINEYIQYCENLCDSLT